MTINASDPRFTPGARGGRWFLCGGGACDIVDTLPGEDAHVMDVMHMYRAQHFEATGDYPDPDLDWYLDSEDAERVAYRAWYADETAARTRRATMAVVR